MPCFAAQTVEESLRKQVESVVGFVDEACSCQYFHVKLARCETMAAVFMPGGQQAVYLVVEEQDVFGRQGGSIPTI